jgi:5-methylcytosine-specific restriction endonuclease McrA
MEHLGWEKWTMTEFQFNLFELQADPVRKSSVAEWYHGLPKGLMTSEQVKIAWMTYPAVEAFIRVIPQIKDETTARAEYRKHLDNSPTFESFSRTGRRERNSDGVTAQQRGKHSKKCRVKWYEPYRHTDHWRRLKDDALQHCFYQCCLCVSRTSLQMHHKHYASLGREQLSDVSILCDNCHDKSHAMLGVCIPTEMPLAVRDVFEREGVQYPL